MPHDPYSEAIRDTLREAARTFAAEDRATSRPSRTQWRNLVLHTPTEPERLAHCPRPACRRHRRCHDRSAEADCARQASAAREHHAANHDPEGSPKRPRRTWR